MSLYWIALAILFVPVAVLALLLFSPLVTELDTRRQRISVRWSPLLAYQRPLPGCGGMRRLWLAGIQVTLPEGKKKPRKEKREKSVVKDAEANRRRKRRQARLAWECLLDGDIRGALLRRFRRLPADLWDSVEVSRWEAELSAPDPALNGMLWGALAAADCGPRAHVQCNFVGRNELCTEVRLYPHRVVRALLLFFMQLPYRAVYRRWRAL